MRIAIRDSLKASVFMERPVGAGTAVDGELHAVLLEERLPAGSGGAALAMGPSAEDLDGRSTPMIAPEIHWQHTRTELANERTFLAWVRTALSLFGLGFGILKVGPVRWFDEVIALLFLSCAVFALLVGVRRYFAVNGGLHRSFERLHSSSTAKILLSSGNLDMKATMTAILAILIVSITRCIAAP